MSLLLMSANRGGRGRGLAAERGKDGRNIAFFLWVLYSRGCGEVAVSRVRMLESAAPHRGVVRRSVESITTRGANWCDRRETKSR